MTNLPFYARETLCLVRTSHIHIRILSSALWMYHEWYQHKVAFNDAYILTLLVGLIIIIIIWDMWCAFFVVVVFVVVWHPNKSTSLIIEGMPDPQPTTTQQTTHNSGTCWVSMIGQWKGQSTAFQLLEWSDAVSFNRVYIVRIYIYIVYTYTYYICRQIVDDSIAKNKMQTEIRIRALALSVASLSHQNLPKLSQHSQ